MSAIQQRNSLASFGVVRAFSGTFGPKMGQTPRPEAQIAAVYNSLAEVAQW